MVAVLLGRGLFHAGKKYGPRAIPLARGMAIARVKGIPRSVAMGYIGSTVTGYLAMDALSSNPQILSKGIPVFHLNSNEYGVVQDDERFSIPYLR